VLALASALSLAWLTGLGCASATKQELDQPLLSQAWNTIQRQYVDQAAVKPTVLTYGAIQGMVDALDDTGHSTFLTPAMVKHLQELERGELNGIGVEIQVKGGEIVIVAPLDNSPAQRAGLRAGDVILKVDGQDVSDWPLSRVVERITGRPGTQVKLTILEPRTGRTQELTVRRATIKLHEVTWQLLPGTTIVHLRLATFDAGVTKDLQNALAQIRHAAASAIILDLRNNPGGLLDEAIGVASQFLEDGNALLVKDAKGRITPMHVRKGGLAPHLPLAVLINEGTASAAEIVAGALQDAHRATLIGDTTFGTGTVLQQFQLSDGSALLLAVEEWLTPGGRSFWHTGLTPEVALPLPAEAAPLLPEAEHDLTAAQLHSSNDSQLLRALELLAPLVPSAKDTPSP
jgi:carboxyl-terminal processing protease